MYQQLKPQQPLCSWCGHWPDSIYSYTPFNFQHFFYFNTELEWGNLITSTPALRRQESSYVCEDTRWSARHFLQKTHTQLSNIFDQGPFYEITVPQDYSATRLLCHKITVSQDYCATRLLCHKSTVSQDYCATRLLCHKITMSQEYCATRLLSHKSTVSRDYCATRLLYHKNCRAPKWVCVSKVR